MDELLHFSNEPNVDLSSLKEPWRILIVDDDPDIHAVTTMVLDKTVISERQLNFTSVYSAKEAIELLSKDENFALIFMDIVMESDQAGLEVVEYIRDTLKNTMVRIIIRTGEPGNAPEKIIIDNYDINDYKEKTDLTATKLYTTVRTSLLQYEQIESLYAYQNSLETIIEKKTKQIHLQEMALFESSKQSQMGELLSMIAHQWRQPLSRIGAVVGQVQLGLSLESMSENEVQSSLQTAETYIQHLSTTISDFQNLYIPDKMKNYTELSTMINNTFSLLKTSLDSHNIKVDTKTEIDLNVTLNAELQQVFINIIKNAFDIIVKRKISDGEIMIDVKRDNDNILIRIEDNAGLEKKLDNKIFEPYVSNSEEKNGKGLGLYMSKIIVEKHCDGQLTVEMGKVGACFELTLPLSAQTIKSLS